MASRLYDGFNRNSNSTVAALGTSDSGHAWALLSSGVPVGVTPVGVQGDKAYLSPDPTVTAAALDAGSAGQDGLLSCSFVGPGVSLGLLFRAQDAANHWVAYQRVYTYQYQSGTETYVSGYTQVFSHYEKVLVGYTPTEYLWRRNFPTGVTHNYEDLYGLHYQTRWSTSSTSNTNPWTDTSLGHRHLLSGQYYPGDDHIHGHEVFTKTGFYTGTSRGGEPIYETRAVYSSQPIYSTRAVFATATGYELRLARRVTGVLTTVKSSVFAGPAIGLEVRLDKDSIEVQAKTSQTSAPILVTDATFNSLTKHGLSLVKSESGTVAPDPAANYIDDFTFTPLFLGSLQPPVLL